MEVRCPNCGQVNRVPPLSSGKKAVCGKCKSPLIAGGNGVATLTDADFNRSIEECAKLTRRRGIESARERNENRAYYACGAVFGLIAESASGRSFFRFVKNLIDTNRADGIVSRAEWLAALDSASRKPELSRDIARLLDRGAPDPPAFIASLFERAGVVHSIDERGMPRLP